jgi:GNAT superfamily N-acetyltransferase
MVRPLRLAVLRPGRPPESVATPKDDLPDTHHVAAIRDGEVVGVMTLFSDPAPSGEADALRIRWMAVRPELRGEGIGRLLLNEAFRVARERSAALVWADARDSALGFYERNGFSPIGKSFIDPETQIAHTPVSSRVPSR